MEYKMEQTQRSSAEDGDGAASWLLGRFETCVIHHEAVERSKLAALDSRD